MENPSKSPSKVTYKVLNWQEYNKSLKKRGQLSIWLSPRLLRLWQEIDVRKVSVGEQIYPDVLIEFCLTIKNIYNLALRQTTGFVEDLLSLNGLKNCSVPDFSTLSRRAKKLSVSYYSSSKSKKDLHLIVDSTGLKVYGEGEWKVKKHGISKHRTWLKLHLCIDAESQEIVCMSLTDNTIDDANAAKDMILKEKLSLISLRGDGAYDKFFFRELLGSLVLQKIPPPKNAVHHKGTAKKPLPAWFLQRNEAVERIKEVGSKEWKKEIGYHQRSIVETTMFRYKIIFGDKSSARTIENQETEAKIKCNILNVFTKIGMPKTTQIFKK